MTLLNISQAPPRSPARHQCTPPRAPTASPADANYASNYPISYPRRPHQYPPHIQFFHSPRSASRQGMAHRDRPAKHIGLLNRQLQLFLHSQPLRRKRLLPRKLGPPSSQCGSHLVHLDDIHILDGPAHLPQCLAHRHDRADTHDLRLARAPRIRRYPR